MNLARLPAELLNRVLSEPCLCNRALKSLRLTCRYLEACTTPFLFRRIGISRLQADWEAFWSVANTPKLAVAVRTLVWYELGYNRRDRHPDDRNLGLKHEFANILYDADTLFWWPPRNPFLCAKNWQLEHSYNTAKADAVREFFPLFCLALEKMKGLHAFVSQPMGPCRQLQSAAAGYPLTAQSFGNELDRSRASDMNEGFRTFMLPAMKCLASNSSIAATTGPAITRLYFADEGMSSCLRYVSRPGGLCSLAGLELYLSSADHDDFADEDMPNLTLLAGFCGLTHLDLCLSTLCPDDLPNLSKWLEAAANLTHLHLCLERHAGIDLGDSPYSEEMRRLATGLHSLPHMPRLVSAHLTDVPFSTDGLVRFVQEHASTLRHLRLDLYCLRADAVIGLGAIPGLRLESFVVLPASDTCEPENPDFDGWHVDDEKILSFINNRGCDEAFGNKLERYAARKSIIYTHLDVFDKDLWIPAAVCDARGRQGPRRGYDPGYVYMLDAEAGEWRDLDGHTYEDLGPDRAEEREVAAVAAMTAGEYLSDEEDERPMYAREHISHLRHYAHRHDHDDNPPRWAFTQDPLGRWHYWQVQQDRVEYGTGCATEMWHFRHRNGEEAWGDDPLEFWSDWEGSDAGDVEEVTPFGWALTQTLIGRMPGHVDWDEACKKEALGLAKLVQYDPAQDPMTKDCGSYAESLPAKGDVNFIAECIEMGLLIRSQPADPPHQPARGRADETSGSSAGLGDLHVAM